MLTAHYSQISSHAVALTAYQNTTEFQTMISAWYETAVDISVFGHLHIKLLS